MIKKSSIDIRSKPAPAEYFTGQAWLDTLVRNEGVSCSALKVTFKPGARNHWHTHPAGQILIATEGIGYVQKKGEPVQLLLQGDVVTILPGEVHWHGASPDSLFSHIAIQFPSGDGIEVAWLDPVTENEYSSYKNPG